MLIIKIFGLTKQILTYLRNFPLEKWSALSAIIAVGLSFCSYKQSLDASSEARRATIRDQIARQNKLIEIGDAMGKTVADACDRYAATIRRKDVPDYISGADPLSKAMVASNALKAIGNRGTDDPGLVFDMSELAVLLNPDRFQSFSDPTVQASKLEENSRLIKAALKRVDEHKLKEGDR